MYTYTKKNLPDSTIQQILTISSCVNKQTRENKAKPCNKVRNAVYSPFPITREGDQVKKRFIERKSILQDIEFFYFIRIKKK